MAHRNELEVIRTVGVYFALALLLSPLVLLLAYATHPARERLRAVITRKNPLERNRRTDVRNIERHLPNQRSGFDPRKHFGDSALFIGLDERKRTVTTPLPTKHIQVVGTSGAGKGRLIGGLLTQFARAGEFVVMGDPKGDDWLPHLAYSECERAGIEYRVLDLRSSAPPQINLFADASPEQVAELLSVAFNLEEEGSGGPDFYKPQDRSAARFVACAIQPGDTPASLCARLGEDLRERAENFFNRFSELAAMPPVNASEGLSIKSMMDSGGVLYVLGSMRDASVRMLQRMLLVRILQIAEARDFVSTTPRQVAVVLDEAKAWISAPAMEFLGAARSKGCHLVLSHQSLADLKTAAGMNPDATVDAVVENCSIKIFYRVQNPETAEWIARMTGEILVDDEVRQFETGLSLSERMSSKRSVRQASRNFFDTNILLNLPDGWSVVTGIGMPKLVQISHVPCVKSQEALRVIAAVLAAGHSATNSPEPI